MNNKYFVLIRKHLDLLIPNERIEKVDTDETLMDKIWIYPARFYIEEESIKLKSALLFEVPFEFTIPGIDSLSFSIGGTGLDIEIPLAVVIIPNFSLTVGPIQFFINFETNFLKRVERDTENEENGIPKFKLSENQEINIAFGDVSIYFSLEGDFDISFGSAISLPPLMIGNSKVVVKADQIIPVFSGNRYNEVIPNSIPNHWRGVYLNGVKIYLPSDISAAIPSDITIEECFIGSGGFCGKFSGNWTPQLNANKTAYIGNGAGHIFGIPIAIKEVALEFKQNTFVQSTIKAGVILPFFDQPIVCELNLTNDGDFTLGISTDQTLPVGIDEPQQVDGLWVFTKENLIELKLRSIAFEKKNNLLAMHLGGSVKPLFGGLQWPEIDVPKLTIDSRGKVSVEGGWLSLIEQKTLNFHGFTLEISQIGFGKEADGSRWIGISGGINIINGIPFKGAVEGLKIIWSADDGIRLQISGIKVAFEIEDVLTFDGQLFFIDEPTVKGFKGGVNFSFLPFNMGFDAQFMAGRNTQNPSYNFFYIYIDVDLPVGIPLGSTGLSLYGLAALFGYNVMPDKKEDEAWYENENGDKGYYLRDTIGITNTDKWTHARDNYAFGGGLTIGTVDDGFTFASKALLVVLVPGPVILIEGRTNLLKKREELDNKPLFRTLAVFDGRAGTFLLNIEANYKVDDKGKVVDLRALGEIYFNFNNPQKWHVYLGQETPIAKRVRAKVLSLFDGNSYFMVGPELKLSDGSKINGVVVGAWVGYDKTYKFGPVSVHLYASIAGHLEVNINPFHAKARLTLEGGFEIKVFGIGFGLSAYAFLQVQTPTPWQVWALVKVMLNLPWPLKDKAIEIELEWKKGKEPDLINPIAQIGIEHLKVKEKLELNNSNHQNSPIVPLDAKPVITFTNPVKDSCLIGSNASAAPAAELVGDYKLTYEICSITLKAKPKRGTGRFEAVANAVEILPNDNVTDTANAALYGKWQIIIPSKEPQNLKLMLWANSPFDISREQLSNEAYLQSFLNLWQDYPCVEASEPVKTCINFNKHPYKKYSPIAFNHDTAFYSPNAIIEIFKYDSKINTIKALRLEENKKSKTECIYFKELTTPKEEIYVDGLIIKGGGYKDQIQPVEITHHYGLSKNNTPKLRIGWSGEEINSSITFSKEEFPEAPTKVLLSCLHSNSLYLEAYDEDGNEIDNTKHQRGQKKAEVLELSGNDKGIRRIDIIGAEILIDSVCYFLSIGNSRSSNLEIQFPEKMSLVELYFTEESKGMLLPNNDINDNEEFYIKDETKPVIIQHQTGFDKVTINGTFGILQVCMVSKQNMELAIYNQQRGGNLEQSIQKRWGRHTGLFLKPNMYYKLIVTTKAIRKRIGSTTIDKEEAYTNEVYFQTANAPGMYPSQNNVGDIGSLISNEVIPNDDSNGFNEHYPTKGLLKDLSAYINHSIPIQTASNEPKIPHYRTYDVGISFNENKGYVEKMYFLVNNTELKIILYDNNGQLLLDHNGEVLSLRNAWSENSQQILTREEKQWGQLLSNSDCNLQVNWREVERSSSILSGHENLLLQPQAIYQAHVKADDYTIYSFNFLTSRYANFTHHIHSFQNVVWSIKELENSLIDELLSENDITILQSILEDIYFGTIHTQQTYDETQEAYKFEQLMDLFGLGIRPLPEQLEALLIDDILKKYALLIESPEPIDWERIRLEIEHKNNKLETYEALDNLKIIDITSSSSQNEWIEILVKESGTLVNYNINIQEIDKQEVHNYYTFSDNTYFNAGTTLRIHTGSEDMVQHSENMQHNIINLYANFQVGQFENKDMYVILKNERGTIIHQFNFYDKREGNLIIVGTDNTTPKIIIKRKSFSDSFQLSNKKHKLIRNKDNTRAFLFKTNISGNYQEISIGNYELKFEFHGNIGEDKLQLKKNGIELLEATKISFRI